MERREHVTKGRAWRGFSAYFVVPLAMTGGHGGVPLALHELRANRPGKDAVASTKRRPRELDQVLIHADQPNFKRMASNYFRASE